MDAVAERKSVVFVLSGYGWVARGAERFVESLAVRLGDEFHVSVLGGGRDAPCAVQVPVVRRDAAWVRTLDRLPGVGHVLRTFQMGPLNREWRSCARSAWRWLMAGNRCDLLVVEGGRWGGWLGRRARQQLGIPFVDVAHGAVSRWEMAAARANPDAYVAPTRTMAEEMVRRVPALKVRVIPFGVDRRRFCPEGERISTGLQRPVALAVGALERKKRMDVAIRAVAQRGEGSLLLVGDGPLREELCRLGGELLGEGRFLWRATGREEMPALYRSADVLVSASETEAFGLVYAEAMACGVPVVTRADATRREVLGDAAYWMEEGAEAEEMAASMDRALAGGPEGRERGLARVAELDEEKMAEAYRGLFRELLAMSKR